jgi:hypothetical protein
MNNRKHSQWDHRDFPGTRARRARLFALGLGLTFAGAGIIGGCGGDDASAGGAAGTTGANGGGAGQGGTSGKGGAAGTGGRGDGGTNTPGAGGENSLIDPSSYDGRWVFRFDTFGNEAYWTDQLRLNEAIHAALDPMTALSLGLKVDADVLPEGILETADLTDPRTTVALIGLDAVVGIKGTVDDGGNLVGVGITCALCHSDVDDSVMDGIGSRVDGAANVSLDAGAIVALAPALADQEDALSVLKSWGPGFYDPRWNQDGINHPVVIPPAYGLEGVPLETYTGDGPVSYWNAYVAVTQMHGQGNFFDPRIDVAVAYENDRVTPKLPALFEYQMSLEPEPPPAGTFDADAAERGSALFDGAARCSTCHLGERYTDAHVTLHAPEETEMDPTYANRSATGMYRTTPLRALLAHPPYFHDGSAETLEEVVVHYEGALGLELTAEAQADLVEFLKSL